MKARTCKRTNCKRDITRIKEYSVLLFFLFMLTFSVVAQDKYVTLSGKVVDSKTYQPVPFAAIQLKERSAGTVSNTNGEFIFKVAEAHLPDTLLISCVGYKTMKRPITRIGFAGGTIALEQATVVLDEVTVKAQSGFSILKEAIARIPQNYDTAALGLTAFYREKIALEDYELTFNEAVLDIYGRFGKEENYSDQIRIIKGRKRNRQNRQQDEHSYRSDGMFYPWISSISNGARGCLQEDYVKYTHAKRSPFNAKNFRYYTCSYLETIREDNRDLIVLELSPKKKQHGKGFLQLTIYLDEASLAIVKYDADVSPAGLKFVNAHGKGGRLGYAIMSKAVKATLDFTTIKVNFSYKQYQGKWYLNTIRTYFEGDVDSRVRNMTDWFWYFDRELIITDINTENPQPFTQGNIGESTSPMRDLIGNDYDEAFWENYNILKPSVPDSVRTRMMQQDSLKKTTDAMTARIKKGSNRQNGFTRGDTLRGKLTPLRTCYDVTFYHLDVAVNMEDHSVKGNNLIRFNVMVPFNKMQVDLYANMKIDKILFKGQPLPFTREYDAVFVTFPEILQQEKMHEIKIFYEGVPKVPDRDISMDGGVLWDKDEAGNPWAQVVCQGSGASLWFPNKDHLSDEPDSARIWITVPSEYTEVSNGRLQRKTKLPNAQTRYEWYVSYPTNNYNITFSIGRYAHYTDSYISDDTLTIDYYVMPYNLERSKNLFSSVKPMLQCFEQHFGKYPFRRDGFTLVESLHAMEHQSGVCIGRITEQNAVPTNPLMWHESAHEWWGNAITCTDIADMWMHEAFATYAEALMVECSEGKEASLDYVNGHRNNVANREPIIGVYDVNHIHYDIGDMYEKGMLMINTFRYILNDDTLWFDLLRNIQQHFRYQTLSSSELVSYINQQTKQDYTWFFKQYLLYTKLPELQLEIKEQSDALVIKYRWQTDEPGFKMPIRATTEAGRFEWIYPTTKWKSMTLKGMTLDEFELDEEHAFIIVTEQ